MSDNIKIAYLSVQSREIDRHFSGDPHVSYGACCLEDFEPNNVTKSRTHVFQMDTIEGIFDILRRSNLIVCYSTYCFDILDKYYESDYPAYYDFSIFDIQDMISNEIYDISSEVTRVYLGTVAKSLGMARKVGSGLAHVDMWKRNQHDKLRESIAMDVNIIKTAFNKVMTDHKWELIDPSTDDSVVLDISRWKEVVKALSKDSIVEKVGKAMDLIKKQSLQHARGARRKDLDESTVRYILSNGKALSYRSKNGDDVLYLPPDRVNVSF